MVWWRLPPSRAVRLTKSAYRHIYMPMAKTRVSFFIDRDLQTGLRALKERDGVPEAESIRRAIADYLKRMKASTKPQAQRKVKR